MPNRSATTVHCDCICACKSSSKGFISAFFIRLPSCVLFHCWLKRGKFNAEMKPTVVLGRRTSSDGAAAERELGTTRPLITRHQKTLRRLRTSELLANWYRINN